MSLLYKLRKIARSREFDKLLPQNLDDNLLNHMMEEIDGLENDLENANSELVVFSVLTLISSKHGFGTTTNSFTIEECKMSEAISYYITALKLEKLRRLGCITIDESSFPTVENIFDKNHKVIFRDL